MADALPVVEINIDRDWFGELLIVDDFGSLHIQLTPEVAHAVYRLHRAMNAIHRAEMSVSCG
jgi:hypothetical protein